MQSIKTQADSLIPAETKTKLNDLFNTVSKYKCRKECRTSNREFLINLYAQGVAPEKIVK